MQSECTGLTLRLDRAFCYRPLRFSSFSEYQACTQDLLSSILTQQQPIPPNSFLALERLTPAFLVSWSHLVPYRAPAPCGLLRKNWVYMLASSASDNNSYKPFIRILHKPFDLQVTATNRLKMIYLWANYFKSVKNEQDNKAADQLDADYFVSNSTHHGNKDLQVLQDTKSLGTLMV